MSLVAGTQEGKVIFFSSMLKKKTQKKSVVVHAHTKRVIAVVTNAAYTLVSVGEDQLVNVFSLRTCGILFKVGGGGYVGGDG